MMSEEQRKGITIDSSNINDELSVDQPQIVVAPRHGAILGRKSRLIASLAHGSSSVVCPSVDAPSMPDIVIDDSIYDFKVMQNYDSAQVPKAPKMPEIAGHPKRNRKLIKAKRKQSKMNKRRK